MRSLMIVDDEKNIRYGLKMMIEREFPGVYDIRTASQGEEALELYGERAAEIIVTDIRMPGMDGIRFIEKLVDEAEAQADKTIKPVVIILSGYDDFEYAKAAIRYQVKEYLLKPIRRDELFAALRKSEETLIRQADMAQRMAAGEAYLDQLQSVRLKEMLEREDMTGEEMQELSGLIGFPSIVRPYRLAAIKYVYEDGSLMKKEELKQLIRHMMEPVKGRISASFFDGESRMVLVGSPDEQFQELSRRFAERELDGLMMGISRAGKTVADIREAYRQARTALQYTFIYPNVNLMCHEDIQEEPRSFPVPEEDIRKIGNMLGTDREREIKGLLLSVFRIDQMPHVKIDYLERVGKRINEQVFDEVFRMYGESLVEVLKLYRKVGSIDNFRHFHDYFRSLEHLMLSVNEYVRGIRSAHSEHTEIKAAVEYMEKNYHRPLNMAMVSNHVSLNYSYFSEAFKAHTGESFVVYLKKIRINKAKELLQNRAMRLGDIGNSVGFENAKQFSRVFKELEGVSPHEYRVKMLSETEKGAP
ncbi:response regulator [Paenibacillus sp. DMB20]|uniref:response regulator n=1 Tax=Paenibacillus sp. DMB20 TaxID=1642570 RepID=UPI000627BF98|nr:response regulator [Paenibacillus sp. DMB20]KKO55192.1 AraC family transcriptional regulator [Paenibacillus sp. DMB20]